MNRSWRSGVHLSLGFASLDRASPELPPPPCKNMCLSFAISFMSFTYNNEHHITNILYVLPACFNIS
ncbi:hypothetical protein Hanom_Chr14g01275271 [Helianthus anomalus]